MYDIIYNFILDNLYNSTDLSTMTFQVNGVSLTMNEYLAHTATIICIALIVLVLCLFLRWIFRVVGGLFLLK